MRFLMTKKMINDIIKVILEKYIYNNNQKILGYMFYT